MAAEDNVSSRVKFNSITKLSNLLLKPVQKMDNVQPLKCPYETRPGEEPYKMEIVWFNVAAFVYLHCAFLFALSLDLNTTYTLYFSE